MAMAMGIFELARQAHFARERVAFRNFVRRDRDLHAEPVRERQELCGSERERAARLEVFEGQRGNAVLAGDLDEIARMRLSFFFCFEHEFFAFLGNGHAVIQKLGNDAEDFELPAVGNGGGFFA